MTGPVSKDGRRWVLLVYRLPREPSTPRIAVWRRLDQLGAVRLGDGLVGVPADARTREQIDWVAEQIRQAGGIALVWLATAADPRQEQVLIDAARTARSAEYQAVRVQAHAAAALPGPDRVRALRRLRAQLRRVERRDFFTAAHREQARGAVESLASDAAVTGVARPGGGVR